MLSLYLFNRNFNTYNLEQRLVQKLLYTNIISYIHEIMLLGFEYSFYAPLILTIESTKGYSFTAPLLRFNELLKLNFNIREFSIFKLKSQVNLNNSYPLFFKLLNSFNNINLFSNALYIMVNSGAKASWNQIYQLTGIRGYLANSSGEFFKLPILNSFNKGLYFFEYFISCYGARKGILDTALKTADSGYLTRRLVESIQELIIKEYDCGSLNYVKYIPYINFNGTLSLPLSLIGKNLNESIISFKSKRILELKNNYISEVLLNKLLPLLSRNNCIIKTNSIKLCLANRSICSKCYGFTNYKSNYIGKNIGLLAGQVIGEPGTQMTLRTFHTGGTSMQTNIKKYKNSQLNNIYYKSFSFFKNIKYKICSKYKQKKLGKLYINNIKYIIYIKKNYFKVNNFLLYIIGNFSFNKLIHIKRKVIFIINNIYLSTILVKYLSINYIYQRKSPFYKNFDFTFTSKLLYRNLIQLIFKNKFNQWIIINLNKILIFLEFYNKYLLLKKSKMIFFKSKNQRYIKLSISLNNNILYSYRNISYKIKNSKILFLLSHSAGYFFRSIKFYKNKKVNFNINNYSLENNITLLKFRKYIKYI